MIRVLFLLSTARSQNCMGQSKEVGVSYQAGTVVDESCSIIWHGQMFIFGGYQAERQISVVDECQVKKVGELPFNMTRGACAQRDNNEVYICWNDATNSWTYRNCFLSNDPLDDFSQLPRPFFRHGKSRIAVTSGKAYVT